MVGVNVVWGKEMVKVYRGYFLAKKKREGSNLGSRGEGVLCAQCSSELKRGRGSGYSWAMGKGNGNGLRYFLEKRSERALKFMEWG